MPAADEQLSTVRLFCAAAARQLGASDDVVEDLRLAMSEACTLSLRGSRAPSSLSVALAMVAHGIAVVVRAEAGDRAVGPAATPPPAAIDDEVAGWGMDLLRAIASDVAMDRDGEGEVSVSFVFPWGSGSRGEPADR